MKNLAPFFVMLALLITIGVAIITITNYILKRRIIDRGPIDENSLQFLNKLSGLGSEVLKWGLIILFGGIGLVILEFIPYKQDSPLPYGVEAIFVSIGFLLYYVIAKKKG